MKFTPLHDKVLVKRLENQTKSEGGILIPDSAQEKQARGKIISVGPGVHRDGQFIRTCVKEGDEVIFSRYGGMDIKVDGEELVVVSELEILGIVNK